MKSAPVVDLRVIVEDAREAALIASTWAGLASRAALADQPAPYVRMLADKAHEAAAHALDRVSALGEALAVPAGESS